MRRALPLLAALCAVAGCGGGGSPKPAAASHRAPEALSACDQPDPGWRTLRLAGDATTNAATLGTGALGVVFANESGGSPCGWTHLAQDLARAGHPVAVTDGPGTSQRALATAVALRTQGARDIVLVGASVGGRAVIQAASALPDSVVGVVSISGERTVTSDQHDLVRVARGVRLPVLFIGSRQDGYTNFGADTRALHRAVPARVNLMLLLSGADHGVDLLSDAHGNQVNSWIEHFLISRSSPDQG